MTTTEIHEPGPGWEDAVQRARARGVDLLAGDVLRHANLRLPATGQVADWTPAVSSAAIRSMLTRTGRIAVTLPEMQDHLELTLDERAALALLLVARGAIEDEHRLPSYVRDLRGLNSVDGDLTPLERRLLNQVDHWRHLFASRVLNTGDLRNTPDRVETVLGWLDEDLGALDATLRVAGVTMGAWSETESHETPCVPASAPTDLSEGPPSS